MGLLHLISYMPDLIIKCLSSLQVEDIETKMDQLMEMYMEDRHRMANVFASLTSSAPSTSSPPPPPPSPSFGAAPPDTSNAHTPRPQVPKKSILIENKHFSEPTTPVAKNFEKTIHRGNSDLSQRCFRKKRVTVRHSLEGTSPSLLSAPRIEIQPEKDRTISCSADSVDPASSESTLGTELDASEPDLSEVRPDSDVSAVTVVMKETPSLLRPSLQNLRT